MRARALFLLPALAGLLSFPSRAVAQATVDAQHYRLEIEVHFDTKTISGTNTATFKSLVDKLTVLDLDLTSSLKVSAVTMGAKPVSFTRPTDKIRITLDRAYAKNEVFTVAVTYSGTPPRSTSFGGFVFTSHSGAQMAWTLSEPWDAKTWWPGLDVLGDKSTFEIWITHPAGMTAASNGTLQGIDTLSGNRVRARWKVSYPIVPYLVSLAVTNYQKRVDTYTHLGAKMPVEFYVFPENFNSWTSGMNRVVPMLSGFSDVYGQYPFVKEKYGIAQFTWGGGMEHQTITSQSSIAEWLTAHEMSHQWWGDAVTCATWHDIWLNEGFATFSEAIWEEVKPGGSMARYHNRIRQRRPSRVSGTVYVTNTKSSGSVFSSNYVYNKGAWVLHQLRHVLGDKLFFQCLADYRSTYEGGSATTDDLRRSCEKTTGRDLEWFFDEWVMKGGAPAYLYGWHTAKANGRDYLYLEIDQTQSTPSVSRMPVDVRVQTSSGTKTYVVEDDERADQFVVPITGPAQSVTLDPDQWILRTGLSSRGFTRPFFAATPEVLDVVTGGNSELHIDYGTPGAGRAYLAMMGLSGSQPGTKVFGLAIPLNVDTLTELGLAALNTPVFGKFLGTLDAGGNAVATFRLPPGLAVSLKGRTLTACYVLADRFDYASRPITLSLR